MSAIQSILIIDTGQTDAVSACSFSGAGSTGVQFNSNSLKPANLDILYTDYGNLIVFNGGDQFFKETGANGTETFKVGVDGAVSEVASCAIPDITAPVITVTGNNPVTVELGTTYTDTGATADGGETVTATVTPTGTVDTSIVREYTITYTATDAAGNIGTATRTVNVVDTTLPLLTVNGDNPATVEMGGTYTDLGATSDGGETVTSTETVDTLTVGAYTITYSATDTAGNIGTATRIVNVVDNTAPIITITGDNPATVELGTTYTDAGATADGGETVTSTGTVDTSTVGAYTITYSATDAANNTGTANRTVNVVDTTLSTLNPKNEMRDIVIYPNPTLTTLTINGNKNYDLKIFNTLGQVLLQINDTNTIDVRSLSDGVYLINITDGIKSLTKRFIKQQM